MYTVEQRDKLREWVLDVARRDSRVTAGAVVGSLALGGGDRYSDLDLTFAIREGTSVGEVLADWTARMEGELSAVHLTDLERGPTTYRVFLLPDALQFDLSMTPAADFQPGGPRFRLLFGQTSTNEVRASSTPVLHDLFGWGVIYALHSRACIERRRLWQAEHYIGAVRDHALSMACLREGVVAVQARGYDDLSATTLDRFKNSHVGELGESALRAALASAAAALIDEARVVKLANASPVAERLAELL